MPSTYYLGQSPDEALGDSPRYWYALRRNSDGELFLYRSGLLAVSNREKSLSKKLRSTVSNKFQMLLLFSLEIFFFIWSLFWV